MLPTLPIIFLTSLMEMQDKGLDLSDEDGVLLQQEHSPCMLPHPMHQMRDPPSDLQPETSIQMKYYFEFRKIYLTSFKLWGEISKQIRLKDDLSTKLSYL